MIQGLSFQAHGLSGFDLEQSKSAMLKRRKSTCDKLVGIRARGRLIMNYKTYMHCIGFSVLISPDEYEVIGFWRLLVKAIVGYGVVLFVAVLHLSINIAVFVNRYKHDVLDVSVFV